MTGKDSNEENTQTELLKLEDFELTEILNRTAVDLQIMKISYEEAFKVYSSFLGSLELSGDLTAAKQLITSGLEVHDSLLNFIKDACQLFGMGTEWVEVKEEPDTTLLNLKNEDYPSENIPVEVNLADLKHEGLKQLKSHCAVKIKRMDCDNKFSCDKCNKSYKNRGRLKEHIISTHSSKSSLQEHGYSLNLETDTQKVPVNINIGDGMINSETENCSYSFEPMNDDVMEELPFHSSDNGPDIDPHHESDNKPVKPPGFSASQKKFSCDSCEKCFKTKGHLKEHKFCAHTNLRPFMCDICDKAFKLKRVLKTHLKLVHKCEHWHKNSNNSVEDRDHTGCKHILENTGRKLAEKTNIKLDDQTPAEQQRTLEVRGLQVSETGPEPGGDAKDSEGSKKLPNTLDSPRKFPCDACDKSFKFKCLLKNHKNLVHTTERPFVCNICSQTCKFEQDLKRHMKMIHECFYCDQTFVTSEEKREHMSSAHPAEWTKEVERKRLRRLNWKPTKKQRATCHLCGLDVASKQILERHLICHTGVKPFKCPECERGFTNKMSLTNHMLQHTGERPIECDVCKRRFVHKYQLKTHYRLHTGEKPFKCEFCDKAFHLGGERNKHRKKCHLAYKLEV